MRVLILGNSGSGKTTLGRWLSGRSSAAFLSLDEVAFESGATRRSLPESIALVETFLHKNEQAVLEGCYADMAAGVLNHLDALIFLNPGTQVCVAHCRARPWEPEKFGSPDAQNALLEGLITWVSSYETREDEYGLAAHRGCFARFSGPKIELTSPAGYQQEVFDFMRLVKRE